MRPEAATPSLLLQPYCIVDTSEQNEMGKKRLRDKETLGEPNHHLDGEAGKAQVRGEKSDKAREFECWRCNATKKSKNQNVYAWHTSEGVKTICNGCHGKLNSLAQADVATE
jgi:hypothetical protein